MERLVARRLRDEIETKLQPQQAGFRPHRSTTCALVQIEALMRRPTQDSRTAAVFAECARAFDSVDHGRIMVALQSLGVSPALQRWINVFLSHRCTRVRANGILSDQVPLTCGVPQGSVLGPLLFIIVVDSLSARLNEIPNLHHGLFADDLSLICRHTDRQYTASRNGQLPTIWNYQL